MTRILVVVGTRPEIIKMASVVKALNDLGADFKVIHTGQHYDWEMSSQFFKELSLPAPDEFLGVGSSSPATQLAQILEAVEGSLIHEKPKIVAVEGDTNSALGAAIAAAEAKVSVAHVEAGCRSYDRSMPEEMNRVLTADLADLNLAPTQNCVDNLRREGIPDDRILLTGHPIVTLIHQIKNTIGASSTLKQLGLRERNYTLFTVHRQENVEHRERLKSILKAVGELPTDIVFPIHPRSRKNIERFRLSAVLKPLRTLNPFGYVDTLSLIQGAEAVITDSGGIQQEAFLLGTPCLTLRKTTEWVETLEGGGNILVEEADELLETFAKVRTDYTLIKTRIHEAGSVFGGMDSAKRVAVTLMQNDWKSSL